MTMVDDFRKLEELLGIPAQRQDAILGLVEQLEGAYTFATLTDTGEIHRHDEARGIYCGNAEVVIKGDLQKYCPKISRATVDEVVEKIRQRHYTPRSEFDNDSNWLHVGNGWVNVNTKEFKGHSPELLSLFTFPHSYEQEAKNPEQLEFFAQIFEEDDLPAVQKFFGYLLLPDHRYKKAFLGIGPKDTGKSKFAELVERFAGMVSHVTLHDMDRHSHNVVKITESLVNTASEVSKYKLKDVSLFKAITGGDEATFRAIYGEPFECRVRSKILVVTNDKPNFDDMDKTFIERWVVFKFTNVFKAGEDMDPNIMERLTTPAEMSGLLNYAIEGLAMLQKDGYFKREAWEDVKADWDSLDSKIAEYHKDHIITKEGAFIPTGELYEDYCKHTESPLSDKMFGRELKKFGVLRKKQRIVGRPTWVYEGITIAGKEVVPIVPMNFGTLEVCSDDTIEKGIADSWVQQEQIHYCPRGCKAFATLAQLDTHCKDFHGKEGTS
jgi:P4 family phage/plasmid primase-like protien